MGLYDNTKPVVSQAPAPAKNPLYANAVETPYAVKAQADDFANRVGVYNNIDVNEYKDYTPFDTGMVFINPAMNDTRALNQSAGEQLIRGAGRLVGTTATKVMADIGYLGGAIGYAFTGDISNMTDNAFSAYFNGLEQDIKQGAAIYKPSWVENGGFWDKVGSLGFWMDEGVDGAAFMASAMVPGLAISKGLKLGTRIANIIGKGAKTANAIDIGATTLLNTVGEAAVEAKGVQDRVRQQLSSKVSQGLMSKEEMETKAADAARSTFFMNAIVLAGPNLLQSRWLFGKSGMGAAEKLAAEKVFNPLTGELIKDVTPVTKRLIAKNIAKGIGMNVVSEGLWEENAQLAIENYNVAKAEGTEKRGALAGIGSNMLENFGTTEGRISMFLGAILGQPVAIRGEYKAGKAEKAQIEKYHKTFGTNYQAYTDKIQKDIKDVFKTEVNPNTNKEEFVLDEDGKRVIDEEKLQNFRNNFQNLSNLEKARTQALLSGDRTGFDYLNNLSFANWAIPMLESGEGSLDMVNKQIDLLSENLEKDITSINEAVSPQEKFDIEKYKTRQKAIAKELHDVIQTETDFSGIWDAPASVKNKADLERYNNFVQGTIREKAFQQATVSWLEKNQEEVQIEAENLSKLLIEAKNRKQLLTDEIKTLETDKSKFDKNETDSEAEFIRKNFNRSNIERQITSKKNTLEKLDGIISKKDKEYKRAADKVESFGEAIKERKDPEVGGLTELSNKELKKKIESSWELAKAQEVKIAEEAKKQEAKAEEQKQEVKNSTSKGEGANDRTIEALEEELASTERVLNEMGMLLEDGDPEKTALEEKIINLREKIRSLKEAPNQNQEVESIPTPVSETTPAVDISEDYDPTSSTTMSSDDRLNPEKSAAKDANVNLKMGNIIPTEIDSVENPNASTYSNVVMHKQLDSIKTEAGKIKFFRFANDADGNPIPLNESGVDFSYVNNPDKLVPGSEIEFRLTSLNEKQLTSLKNYFGTQKFQINQAAKKGIKISPEDNYGFGDITKAIGIYAEDRLIGFVQLPKMYNINSDNVKAQEITRNEIIAERNAILERLNKGEKVTTTISDKGKGNYFSKSIKGNIHVKNQDGTNITPIVRDMDKVEDQSVFAYFRANDSGGTWMIPEFSNKANTKKILEVMRNNLSGINGFNGQVAMVVKTANGTWSPIPIFNNILSESLQDELWNRLTENKELDAKTVISAINDLTYASIDESANVRIYPYGVNTMIQVGAAGPFDLKTIFEHEKEIKEEIKNLRINLVTNKINSKEYQQKLAENKSIVTNVIPVNGDYFLQPFISFDSILSEEVIEEQTKDVKEESANTNLLEISDDQLGDLGLNSNTYVGTIDSEVKDNNIVIGNRAYIVDDQGVVKDTKGTIIKTPSTKAAVLKQEAINNKHFIDTAEHRVLAVLTNKNGVSKREIKIVSLQSNKEITNKKQKEDLAKANPAIGEFIKKFC